MNLYRDLDSLPDRFCHGAVAIGNFDGVHLGHVRIVQRLLAMARELGGAALAFTFDPHPARLLHPELAPAPLCWTERKAQLLGELGVDAVLAYPTDGALLRLEAREFFDRIVLGRLRARGLVEGRNFFFGHDRQGTVEVLRRFCDQAGLKLDPVEPVEIGGRIVSSSLVRRLVAAGEIEEVAAAVDPAVLHPRHGRPRRRAGQQARLSDGQHRADRHAAAGGRHLRGRGPVGRPPARGRAVDRPQSDLRRTGPEGRGPRVGFRRRFVRPAL